MPNLSIFLPVVVDRGTQVKQYQYDQNVGIEEGGSQHVCGKRKRFIEEFNEEERESDREIGTS